MALSNSQYNAIMRIYNQRQFQNKYEQEQRITEVYERLPQIRQIDDAISTQAVACAKRLLEGDLGARQRLKKQISDLREEKATLLEIYGYASDYMDMQYHCKECQDTGYVRGKKCHCFKKEEIRLLYSQSNIQEILEKENFSAFTFSYYDNKEVISQIGMTVTDYMKKIYRLCREYVERFNQKGGNLIFTGSTGVGKTFLTNCIAKELIDRFQSVIYLSANNLVEIFSKNKFHYDTEQEMRETYQYILDCDLLIIDDLGTELNNTFVSSQLFHCINERLLRRKSTIISTNLSIDKLRDTYSDRISSRIISQYSIIPLYGEDIRTKKHR